MSNNRTLCERLHFLAHQLRMRSPIAASGDIAFDWSFLFGMIAAISSFFIILVQFEQS